MSFSERYLNALNFAAEKHKGQIRKGGEPYITHPKAVAEYLCQKGYSEDYQLAGLFHDLLEDTDATEEEILFYSSREVLKCVKLLTKKPGYDQKQYVQCIKNDPMAFEVKAADRIHNLSCAYEASEEFRIKYIRESVQWYLDFSPEILILLKELASTLSIELSEFPFLYD